MSYDDDNWKAIPEPTKAPTAPRTRLQRQQEADLAYSAGRIPLNVWRAITERLSVADADARSLGVG